MNYLLISIVFFWFFHVLQRLFYFLYIWQLKEYRTDRFFEEISRNKALIFPKSFLFVLLLILFYDSLGSYLQFFVLVLYLFFGLRSLYLFSRRGWKLPVFTGKMVILLILSLAFLAGSVFLFSSDILRFILFLEIVFPIFIFFPVLFIQIPTFFLKQYIFYKARKKREGFKDLTVIGITGSYGKSSTKDFLFTLLSEKYKVLKTEGNINTEMGIANTVLSKIKTEHQVFICEMGAYKRGEIKNACSMVKPKIGVLTGINQQHLALFGSQENIILAKYELIESLPADGIAFFNAKNKYCLELYGKTKIKKELYGREAKIAGEENIFGAMAVARYLGMTEEEKTQGLGKIKNRIGGISLSEGANGLKVVDATYSSNPSGVMAHLEYLKGFGGKKVIVMPCLIELGSAAKEIHREIGKRIAEVCDLAIITSDDYLKEIKEGAGEKAIYMNGPKDIFAKIKSFCGEGDIILLESRVSHSMNLTDQLISLLVC